MDWIDKLDSKNARAWEELMVDYLYDLDDWNEARVQLLQLLKNDQRNASEADLARLSFMLCRVSWFR